MSLKKVRLLAEVVGFVTLGILAFLGALSLLQGSAPALAAIGLAAPQAPAAPAQLAPTTMGYLGHLKDAAGNPLQGTYTMTFRIYDSPTAVLTDALWSETHVSVTVSGGIFNVVLGAANPLASETFAEPTRLLGITVAPYDELLPRQQLTSVPYGMVAARAAVLSAADGDPVNAVVVDNSGNVNFVQDINVAGNATVTGSATVAGNATVIGNATAGSLSTSGTAALGATTITGDATVSGKVGVGTTTPGQELSAIGIVRAANDINETQYVEIGHDGGNAYINTVGDGNLDFRHDGTNKMSLSPAGHLDVGGDIEWDGHLGNISRSSLQSVEAADGQDYLDTLIVIPGYDPQTSICFLTKVELEDIDTMDEEAGCRVHQSGNYQWWFSAKADGDSSAYCEALCIEW